MVSQLKTRKMSGSGFSTLLGALIAVSVPVGAHEALEREAQAHIKPFVQELMSTVTQAMQAKGPAAAVEACNILAPEIAAQHSAGGWKVGRTTLRLRNSDNAPDEWERSVLEQFQQAAEKGQPLTGLKYGERVNGEYRYMQAIGVAEPCLACHGQTIRPELRAVIDSRYPQDQATGFSQGDLRGAFTLRKRVE